MCALLFPCLCRLQHFSIFPCFNLIPEITENYMKTDDCVIHSGYVQLAMTYVEAINNGAIPCIASAVELLKNNECRRAMEEAASMFDATMSEELQGRLPVQVEELTRVQKVAHARALEVYRKGALFDSAQTYVSKLSVSGFNKIYIRDTMPVFTRQ